MTARRWLAFLAEDLPDRGRGYFDAEDQQFAVDPAVTPALVLPGQAQYQGANRPAGWDDTHDSAEPPDNNSPDSPDIDEPDIGL